MLGVPALSPPILTLSASPAPRSAASSPVAMSPSDSTIQSVSGLRWISLTIAPGTLPAMKSEIGTSSTSTSVSGETEASSVRAPSVKACRIG